MKISKKFLMTAITISTLTFALSSCYYDNEEELYSNLNNDTTITCDTLSVTYAVQIKPIFDSKCISCHGSAGTQQLPLLDNFAVSHEYAIMTDNKLLEYINTGHQSLTYNACERAQLTKWVNTGAN